MMPRALRLVLVALLIVCALAGAVALVNALAPGRIAGAIGRALPPRTQPTSDASALAVADSLHRALAELVVMRRDDSTKSVQLGRDSIAYLAARARLLAAISSARQPGTAGARGESVTSDVPTPPPPETGADSVTAGEPSSSLPRSHLPPLLGADPDAATAFVLSADATLRSCYAVRASCEARADSAEHVATRATAALDTANAHARRATLWRIAEDVAMILVGSRLH